MAYKIWSRHMKDYNARWMREYRARQRSARIIASGHCPLCLILLRPEFEKFHQGCPWYLQTHTAPTLVIHAEYEEWREDFIIGI
jgi:hypothetical protein